MNVLVLGGGGSTERDVSLRSAAAVAAALKQAGYSVQQADPRDGNAIFDSISPDTIVFPILHGTGGEDGEIQAEIEAHNLPYLGSTVETSQLCFDKNQTRAVLQQAGIPIAEGGLVTKDTYSQHRLARAPHALKVTRGGSSIGTYLVYDPAQIDQSRIDEVFKLDSQAVIEQLIQGTEITVPIFDNKALPVIEIVPPDGQEFDYENKYNGKTQDICPPVSVDGVLQQRAQAIAEETHKVLGARHLSRVDIMVDKSGGLYVLELNTMPGMTNQSLYPVAAGVAGMTMPELVKRFVELVKRDYGIKETA